MSLTEEYKELDKIRKDEADKSLAHYKSVDVPGTRTKGASAEAARKRIHAMLEERNKAGQ